MSNDLIQPIDLVHLPGAPFTEQEVDEAVASLRGTLGWHIAPVKSETVTLDVTACDPVLRLPTRKVVTVDEIRNTTTSDVITASSYAVSLNLNRVRRYSWPSGYGAVEVDLTHGYAACPPELRPIIARSIVRSRGSEGVIVSESVDDYSVKYSEDAGSGGDYVEQTLDRYSIRQSWPASI